MNGNERIVLSFVDAVNVRDFERIASLSIGDFIYIGASGARIEGREAVCDAWRNRFACSPDCRIVVSECFAAGNRVALFGYAEGPHPVRTAPDGKNCCRLPAAWRAEVREDRIALWQVYGDSARPCDGVHACDRTRSEDRCPSAEAGSVVRDRKQIAAAAPSADIREELSEACPLNPQQPRPEFEIPSQPAEKPSVALSDACPLNPQQPQPGSEIPSQPAAEAPELLTGRLRLRAFREEDAEALFACCRNPELGENAGWKPHESIDESRRVLKEVFLGQRSVWAVALRDTGRLVGSVGLLPDPKRGNPGVLMLGYWLDRSQWGRGLMSEAARAVVRHGFEALGADMLSVCCYAHNGRSRRVIERLGFRFEGTLHAADLDSGGRMRDVLSYYLLRDEWAKNR